MKDGRLSQRSPVGRESRFHNNGHATLCIAGGKRWTGALGYCFSLCSGHLRHAGARIPHAGQRSVSTRMMRSATKHCRETSRPQGSLWSPPRNELQAAAGGFCTLWLTFSVTTCQKALVRLPRESGAVGWSHPSDSNRGPVHYERLLPVWHGRANASQLWPDQRVSARSPRPTRPTETHVWTR